jgi:LmbE family N-acetylglucosaminyl deacetylase
MKKIIFGIFAHPDDEAFGPCGTLLRETRAGTELHLITLTNGSAGTNPDDLENLGEARLKEWQTAGELLGATTMHHFGYQDGKLNNEVMIEASQRLVDLITSLLKNESDDVTVEFMTLDLNGLTGHIDHIVAARAACFAFYTLKVLDTRLTRIRLACLPAMVVPNANTSWLYMEAGRSTEEINETIDARNLRDDILTVMHAHHTQRGDGEGAIKSQGANLGLNYFIVKD